jgi:hypothetical protein
MTRLSPSNSQFDSFLYAPLYETGETSLSVLSALARQDIDGWEEAARLDQLPKGAAINSFASTIWKSDSERWSPTDASIIAARLIEHLPSHQAASPVSSIPIESTNSKFMMWLVYGILLGSIAASSNMQSNPSQPNQANRTVVQQQATQSIPAARTD